MNCRHFGECGSCSLFRFDYKEQLSQKKDYVKALIEPFFDKDLEVFTSLDSNYRARAEFRIWHDEEGAHYAMGNLSKDGSVIIEECPKVIKPIEKRMDILLDEINKSKILSHKLFGVEFLAGTTDDVLITMLYHRQLDDEWIDEAKRLENIVSANIIGRARKQKIVISKDYITESIKVEDKEYLYRHYEGGFTQPNPFVNKEMITWAKQRAKETRGDDLLEAYCGLGNFTIPLSECFDKVLATEISKNSIKAAKENCKLNKIENISFIRLSSEEMTKALNKERSFNRLKDIDLDSYNFSTVLVDPPRAGLDSATTKLISRFENIIYISCNPETLARDLKILTNTHTVQKGAIFDQFPNTSHIESGVFLVKKGL